MEKPPLSAAEVYRVMAQLAPLTAQPEVVLIGGQAVSYWSNYFKVEERIGLSGLFASKDIDFEGRAEAALQASILLDGEILVPSQGDMSPQTGQVLFLDSQGHQREVDFLSAPTGLDAEDVRKTAVSVGIPDPRGSESEIQIWVMHPERSMESRVKNWMILKKRGKIAEYQLQASIFCAREFSRYILTVDQLDEKSRVRAVLNLNERIFKKCFHDLEFRNLYKEFAIDPFDAVLDHEKLPQMFREVRLPQMRASLEAKRSRQQIHRED